MLIVEVLSATDSPCCTKVNISVSVCYVCDVTDGLSYFLVPFPFLLWAVILYGESLEGSCQIQRQNIA